MTYTLTQVLQEWQSLSRESYAVMQERVWTVSQNVDTLLRQETGDLM